MPEEVLEVVLVKRGAVELLQSRVGVQGGASRENQGAGW